MFYAEHPVSETTTLDLVTTAEAAEILGVKVQTVSRWARQGGLTPAYEPPKNKRDRAAATRLFHRADVLAHRDAVAT